MTSAVAPLNGVSAVNVSTPVTTSPAPATSVAFEVIVSLRRVRRAPARPAGYAMTRPANAIYATGFNVVTTATVGDDSAATVYAS